MPDTRAYFAYVITVRFKPDVADSVIARYQEHTSPLVSASPGLLSMLGLVNRHAGRGMTVRVWASATDRARTDAPSEAILDDFSAYTGLLTGAYTRDPFDVTVYALPRAAATSVARVTTQDLRDDLWGEGSVAIRSLARGLLSQQAAPAGMIVCENRALGRVLLIEVADSARALAAGADVLDDHEIAARRGGYLRRPAEHTLYDVISRY